MARIKENKVTYFPHPCTNGSRMYIMEQKFNDKGYVAYYKLLEMLGDAEGHFLDFKQDRKRLHFGALIRADEILTIEILNTLCELEVIDAKLWKTQQIAWCQEFVDSIREVYVKRQRELPQRPGFCPSLDGEPSQTGGGNPQSKVNKSKVNKSKLQSEDLEKSSLVFPFEAKEFLEAWDTWKLYKIAHHKFTYKTIISEQAALNDVSRISNNDIKTAIHFIYFSISKTWRGVYPDEQYGKSKQQTSSNGNQSNYNASALRQLYQNANNAN